MILKKKVAQLCKRSKGILLATAKDKTQWVGAHSAAYSLAGMPAMSIEEVMVAFDYTEDEKAKFTTASVIDLGDLISDSYADEILVEENSKSVYFNDVHYVMYNAGGRVILINSEYLVPIKTCGETRYYIRFKETGECCLCVKNGMIAEAVIAERNFTEGELEALLNSLRETAKQIEDGYAPCLAAETDYDEESEQLGMEDEE